MSDLSGKFNALETQLTSQHNAEQTTLDAMSARLDEFSTTFDTLLANNAANTRYILAALAQLDPCGNCAAQVPLPPALVPGGAPIDSDRCKRIQAFLAAVASFASAYDTLVSYNVVATVSLLNSTASSVLGDLISGGDLPLPSVPEAINIVGNYFSFASANIFSSISAADSLSSIYSQLLPAMYISSGVGGAVDAYKAVIDGSTLNFAVANLLKSTAYNSLANYYLDPASSPDLTPYDGSVCVVALHDVTSCVTLESVPIEYVGHVTQGISAVPTAPPNIFYFAGDFFGWTFELVNINDHARGVDVYRTTDGSNSVYTHGTSYGAGPFTISDHGLAFAVVAHDADWPDDGTQFTFRFCPPS